MSETTENFTGTVVVFDVPTTGIYDITADGASGGSTNKSGGNDGAEISGQFQLTAGAQLTIVVGGKGTFGSSHGGGGSSFVIETFNGTSSVHIPLVIAGGGGGGGYYTGRNDDGGSTAGSGDNGGGDPSGAGGTNGAGGGGGGYAGGGGSFDSGTNQVLAADHSFGNGLVTIDPVCYLRGSRILTPSGEIAVERLRVGDLVTTVSGANRPLRWIGFGRTLVTPHNQDRATPVVVLRHAVREFVPRRDAPAGPTWC